jgi:hypothetical protein
MQTPSLGEALLFEAGQELVHDTWLDHGSCVTSTIGEGLASHG